MKEKDATLLSMIGPIIKDGKKSLITFGNASKTKGKNKKNKSFFKEHIINIIENNMTDKAPSILNPGYWKRLELDDKKAQRILKVYMTAKKNDDEKNKVLIKLLFITLNEIINF